MGLYHNSLPFGEMRSAYCYAEPIDNILTITHTNGKQIIINGNLPSSVIDMLAVQNSVYYANEAFCSLPRFKPSKLAHPNKSKIAKAAQYRLLTNFIGITPRGKRAKTCQVAR